jgi:hypothetical protein
MQNGLLEGVDPNAQNDVSKRNGRQAKALARHIAARLRRGAPAAIKNYLK